MICRNFNKLWQILFQEVNEKVEYTGLLWWDNNQFLAPLYLAMLLIKAGGIVNNIHGITSFIGCSWLLLCVGRPECVRLFAHAHAVNKQFPYKSIYQLPSN